MFKKAQLSLFILIGFLILLIFAIVMYFYLEKKLSQPEELKQVQEVPLEIQPVFNFVGDCIELTTFDAFKVLGGHGGYIYPQNAGITANPLKPWLAKGFEPFENQLIPYWFYVDGNDCTNGCVVRDAIPTLQKIEEEVAKYIENNLKNCYRDFSEFSDKGYNISAGEVKALVNIKENTVEVKVLQEIDVKKDNSKIKMESFVRELDFDFQDIYELAKAIALLEKNVSFIERYTLELMTSYSDLDKNKLPPTYAITLLPGERYTWKKSNIEKQLKEILKEYVPAIQFINSYMVSIPNYPNLTFSASLFAQGLGTLNVSNVSLYKYGISFLYFDNWPLYLKIGGRVVRGDTLEPEEILSGFIPFIAIRRYRYYYDITYPVMVHIHAPFAFQNRGYDFIYGLEVNIRDNKPVEYSYTQTIPPSTDVPNVLCDEQMYYTGNISINLQSSKSDDILSDVLAIYTCGSVSCSLGYSQVVNNQSRIVTRLPKCIGGLIQLQKEGYLTEVMPYTTLGKENKNEEINVTMEPYRFIKIKAKTIPLIPEDINYLIMPFDMPYEGNYIANRSHNFSSLPPQFQLFGTLDRLKQNPYEPDFSVVFELNGSTNYSEVVIVPGNYTMNLNLILQLPVTLYGDQIEKISVVQSKDCFTAPSPSPECFDMINDTIYLGMSYYGWTFSDVPTSENYTTKKMDVNISDLIEITANDLDNNKYLEVYALEYPYLYLDVARGWYNATTKTLMMTLSEMTQLSQMESISLKFKSQIKPRFLND